MTRSSRTVVLVPLIALLAVGAWFLFSDPEPGRNDSGFERQSGTPEAPGHSGRESPGLPEVPPIVERGPGFEHPPAPEEGQAPRPRRGAPPPLAGEETARPTLPSAPALERPSLPVRRLSAPANEAERQKLSGEVRSYLDSLQQEAREKARQLGYPVHIRDAEGRPLELVAVRDGKPVYRTTFNATAAAAARVYPLLEPGRGDPDYELSGKGVTVGVWDEARVLDFHREFELGQVTNQQEQPFYSHHSTHVTGTIAARGTSRNARGMAPRTRVEAYNWNQALAEMTERAPLYPDEPGTVPLANHSYGLVAGWFFRPDRDAFVFTGFERFGRYDQFAYLTDLVAHAAPYQLSVWAAGNHRSGDPQPGDPVLVNDNPVAYDPEIHPPGDAEYKRGFDTINSFQIAKNVLTIGAVNFSTADGRSTDLNEARMTPFSSWGPTDDGRVKPDLVTHGVSVFSPVALDGWYGRASGTSMSAPAVTGSLSLLTEHYGNRFPGHALRASTLKALLVHTADNLGNPGPDSRYGWGLINARAAVELLTDHVESPRSNLVVEDFVSSDRNTVTYQIESNGEQPLQVTLAWTDPPAEQPVEESDDRTPTLVNNLNLRVIAPEQETTYYPYRLNPEVPASPATTGINEVDNVLRVDIPSPASSGTYSLAVDYEGALFGGEQIFSLIASGGDAPSPLAEAPSVSGISPASAANSGSTIMDLSGTDFLLGTDLRLTRSGEDPIKAFGIEAMPERVSARFDLYGATAGTWDLEVHSPGEEAVVIEEAFEVEPDCHFSLEPDSVEVSSSGGYFSARLESSSDTCEWTLESSEDWLLFLTPRSGTGDAEVIYSVGNHGGSAVPRSAEITIGGRTRLAVNQEGVPPVTLNEAEPRAGFITGRERQADWKYYRFDVPHMTSGEVAFLLDSLTGDADLYVRHGEKPTLDEYDCRPVLGGTQDELCGFADPEPGTWWIGVNNWDTGRIDYVISASLFIEELLYEDWAKNVFTEDERNDPAISGPGADPGDFGIPNLIRYALALDSRHPESDKLPRAGVMHEEGETYLYIEYTEKKAATDAVLRVEVSEDLSEWNSLDGVVKTVDEDAATRTVRVRKPEPVASGAAGFLRLRVTMW